jgi:hypothetical protein
MTDMQIFIICVLVLLIVAPYIWNAGKWRGPR